MTIAEAPRLVSWARDESDPQRRTLRTLAIGVGLSLLLHALLIATAPKHTPDDMSAPGPQRGPMSVRLTPPPSPPPAAATAPVAPPAPIRPPPPAPRIMAVPKAIPQNPVVPLAPPTPPLPVTPPAPTNAPTSMAEMVERARARQQAVEQAAARENAAARQAESGPSSDEIALAAINRNLQNMSGRDGTSGIFQIRSKGQRYGTYTFRGWTRDSPRSSFQQIEVDAGVGGDVELAMVRSMISLIREHYQGDFNWESNRLGKVVVLSARPADTPGLEAFMMKEFFENAR
jgi:hypothetical protein